jgi:hypothetical protein
LELEQALVNFRGSLVFDEVKPFGTREFTEKHGENP